MSTENSIQIDLTGIENKFSTSGRQICADCGKDFDFQGDVEEMDVPLLLWRNNNKEMLTLCWEPCAMVRMQNKQAN